MQTNKSLPSLFAEWWDQRRANRRETPQPGQSRRFLHWVPNRGSVIFTLLVVGLLLWAQTAGAIPLPGYRNAPDAPSTGTIAYQGRLADADGNPLTSTVNMEFRLYSAATGGTLLWSELWTGANAVQVSDGLFNVMLGSLTPIPQNIVTGNGSLWLGITAGTDDEMMPRVQLGSVPFAVQALTVPDGSVTTGKIADGAVTQAKLGVRLPRVLGQKTCDNCGTPTEVNVLANVWLPVKGANNQDIIEVTATIQGGPVMVLMTNRYVSSGSAFYCGIEVLQGGTRVRFIHLDGVQPITSGDYACSGAYVLTDLPAGTYTFRASGWTGVGGNIQWIAQRQIAVFEY